MSEQFQEVCSIHQTQTLAIDINPQLKTPYLKHLCSKHEKEIIIFQLDENCQDDRLLCVDCLPNNNYCKLVTLEEADKMWVKYNAKVSDNQKSLLNYRKNIQKQISEIISKYQESQKLLQNYLKKNVDVQNEILSQEYSVLDQNQEKSSFLKLDINEVKQTLNILAQNGQITDQILSDKVNQFKNKDQKYQQEIFNILDETDTLQKELKSQLDFLFNLNGKKISDDVQLAIELAKQELKYIGLDKRIFSSLIPKLQNQLLPDLQDIWKQTQNKGLKCIEQLTKEKIQDEELIFKYQEILMKFDRQYQALICKLDDSDQTQNVPLQLTKQFTISINSLFQVKCQKLFDSKILKFSTTSKNSNITVSVDGKTAKSTSDGYQLCLCDQSIPKNATVTVDFKVKQLKYIMAGICLNNSYDKNYRNSYSIGEGYYELLIRCYFLLSYGHLSYIYSHHDQQKNDVQGGFLYQQNDIISMEVNIQQKQIIWRNKAKNQSYAMDIQTNSDLYFCFNLYGNNEIELV